MNFEDKWRGNENEKELYVWKIDPESGLVITEIFCGLVRLDELSKLLEISIDKLNLNRPVNVNKNHIDAINNIFPIELQSDSDAEFELCFWSPLNGLPYRLHTRREFVLMSSGQKPLCSLIGRIPPDESFEEIPEYLFDPYVSSGTFIKREYCEINSTHSSIFMGLRVVLYALAGETWRLDAYIQVRLTAKKFGWNESLTYQEGKLLGYSESENDAWIDASRHRQK